MRSFKSTQFPLSKLTKLERRMQFVANLPKLNAAQLELGTEFRSEQIPRNRLGMVSVIPRKKVLIPSVRYGRIFCLDPW